MRVHVKTYKEVSQLEANQNMRAKDLFGLMTKTFGIQESWYFGMSYTEKDDEFWTDISKKRLSAFQSIVSRLSYKVKYYPEDVSHELIERLTIEHFYNQVKNGIVDDKIFCPADTCVLLASYGLQVKFGDYAPDEHNESSLNAEKLLPARVLKQHAMASGDWLKSIINLWTKHKGLDDEEAMLEYLKIAQNLEMYGVSYFPINNKRGTDIYLGVTALGLNIYDKEDILNPKTTFPWSEIKRLNIKDKRFTIKPTNKTSTECVFFTRSKQVSKVILNLGIGNHALYVRRRKPEEPEIKKLREKNDEIRRKRAADRQKINAERKAREALEREISEMRASMALKEENLLEAHRMIKKLQEQLEELRKSKEQLEKERFELQEMMERLEHSKNLEAAERQKLEEEIRSKHAEVERIQEEVRLRDEETRRLQEEVEEAHKREEEARLKENEERERLAEEHRMEQERLLKQLEEAHTSAELEELPEGADLSLPQAHENRVEIQDELKLLQSKLDQTRTEEEETELDKIHKVNLLLGKNKFKTLADIRRGNTVRRVEMFENM